MIPLESLREVREHRAGKRTLRTTRVEPRPLPELAPDAIRRIRADLDVSRAVFTHMIRVPLRTVEGWEQGKSSPPGSAAALILMAEKYPDTFERLSSTGNSSCAVSRMDSRIDRLAGSSEPTR